MRILIVDDEEDLRGQIRRILDPSRHTVVEAADGREALAVLASEPVDLVITDLVMPNMDGIELMRRMKRDHRSVRTIVLSASDYSQDEVFLKIARLMGAVGAFRKPVSTTELSPVVEAVARSIEVIEQSGRLLGRLAPRSQPRTRSGGRDVTRAAKANARAVPAKRVRKASGKRSGDAPVTTYRNPVAEAAMEQSIHFLYMWAFRDPTSPSPSALC